MGKVDSRLTSKIVEPPVPPQRSIKTFQDVIDYLTDDYKHKYLIWNRTGGYNSNISLSEVDVDSTTTGNVDTGEDNLIQYTLAANSLLNEGDFVEVEAFGTFASNANNKRVRFYFGPSLLLDTAAVAANGGSWTIQSKIIRVNSSSQKTITSIISSNSLVTNKSSYVASTSALSANVEIKTTGEATASNDIVQEGLTVKIFNA